MNDIIITGSWDGQPIWRYKTAQEKLLEAIQENIKSKVTAEMQP